eukprot:32154-Eustigmatos_ZCMA.PRE.1
MANGDWSDYCPIHDIHSVLHPYSGRMIRKVDDKFGRSVTKLRHALTDFDRRPLPTVDHVPKHQQQ